MRDANSNFEILNLGFPEYFRSRIASGGSNLACLGELGGNLLPLFPINRRNGVVPMTPHPLGEKNYFREENSSRGASVTLTRRFRVGIREGFPSFFTVLHPFFVLQRISFRIRDFQFISCFFGFHLYFVHFRFSFLPFLTSFNRSFKLFSHLINDKMNFNRSFAL